MLCVIPRPLSAVGISEFGNASPDQNGGGDRARRANVQTPSPAF